MRIVHKGLREFYETGCKRGIIPSHATRLQKLLSELSSANSLNDISDASASLHFLKKGYLGYPCYSIWVSGAWRLVFEFGNGVGDVDYVNYH